jgi:hypothetical protein
MTIRIPHRMQLTGQSRSITPDVHERNECELGGAATLHCEAVFAAAGTFREQGTLRFDDDSAVNLRTLGTGSLTPSSDPSLGHGTVTWDIDGGSGRFTGATGRISSSFTVGPDGCVEDDQVGLIFLDDDHSKGETP